MNCKTYVLSIVITLICSIPAIGQIESLKFELSTTPSNFHSSQHSCNCDPRFWELPSMNKVVILNGLHLELMLSKQFGLQSSLQMHNEFFTRDFIIAYLSGGFFEQLYEEDYDSSIRVKKSYFELPLHFIFRHCLNPKTNISFLLGGAPIWRYNTKVWLRDKIENTETVFSYTKNEKVSRLSSQAQIKISYAISNKFELNLNTIYKLYDWNKFDKYILGAGMGVSYRIK